MKSFTMQEHELFNTALALMKNLNRLSEANELMEKPVPNNLATEFKNRLETAITFPYNRNFNQETQLLHAEADRIVQILKKQVSEVKYFLQKAFPHDSRIWEQYGHCEFEKVSQNFFKTLLCIDRLCLLVKQYRSLLFKLNFPFRLTAEIEQLANILLARNNEIIIWYETNDGENNERIERLNRLSETMAEMEEMLKEIENKANEKANGYAPH